jgi:hypothetical protein
MNNVMRHVRNRPWLAVVALAILQAIVLYVVAAGTVFCCDVAYYLPAGESLWRDGLLWHDKYAGFRFYIAPLVFGFVELVSHALFSGRPLATTMPFLLSTLFLITSSIASIFVFRRGGLRRWALFAIPLLLNPLALAIAPYPLQESVIVAGCLPLLFVLLAHRFESLLWQGFIAGLCIAIAVMTRPTLIWIALPIVLYVFYPLLAARQWNKRASLGAGVLVLVVVAMYLPQAYIHWNLFHTLSPAPPTGIVDMQIRYGVDMLEYGTLQDGAAFRGLPVYSPYNALPVEAKKLSFYVDQPAEGLFLALVHMWSAFDFVSFRPFTPKTAIRIVNITLIISAFITALGVLAIWRMIGDARHRTLGLMLGCTFLLNCAYVAVSATENRFGLLGFLALSIAAWQTLIEPEGRKLYVRASPLVAGYVCLCLIINALLYYRAGWLWPVSQP